MADLRLDDVYQGLAMPWQIDRRDVNGPHGNGFDAVAAPALEGDLASDFWVSTDTGKLCFAPVSGPGSATQASEPGQYYRKVDGIWQRCVALADTPGNVGGFHCCCIDTLQPGTDWALVAKLSDFGIVLGRDSGLRVEFAALVRNDCEGLVASGGLHDECRSLFLVDQVTLPSGRVVIADAAELLELGSQSPLTNGDRMATSDQRCVVFTGAEGDLDGPVAPTGVGAGYYPVLVSRDADKRICRITVCYHPARVARVCRHFPPAELETSVALDDTASDEESSASSTSSVKLN